MKESKSKINVLLINPYITVREEGFYLSEPLGLICLASYLEQVFKDEIEVLILDLYVKGAFQPYKVNGINRLGVSDPLVIQEHIDSMQPDLIGIHCNFTAYATDSFNLAQDIKENNSNIPIMIGGAHPTIESASILQENKCIDYVAVGEGEIIIENMVRYLRNELNIEKVDGILYRDPEGKIVRNKPCKLIPDLDILPIPNRDYVDMEKYKSINKKATWYLREKSVASLMTSRGCPFDCVFCSTKVVWTRKWRSRSLENIFKEIHIMQNKYGIKEFVINDDQFMTSRKRIHEFCDYFIEKDLDISFTNDAGTSIWIIDEELLIKMKKAGFYTMKFPIETGSKKTLKYVNKPVDLEDAQRKIDVANRLGYWTSANIIIGFPYETKEDILESIQYAYDSTLDFTSFLIAHPNAGADMYNDFKKEGLLDSGIVQSSAYYDADYNTVNLTAHELGYIANNASLGWFKHKLKFYVHPKNFWYYVLPKFKSVRDIKYAIVIFIGIVKIKILPRLKSKSAHGLN